MIEGARLLPWLELAARDEGGTVAHLRNCETCMQTQSISRRQEMGCGYEPPSRFAMPWQHRGYNGPPPTVCAGYTTTLAETIEIARAYFHFDKQSFRDLVGKRAHPHLLRGIEAMASEVNAAQAWRMKNPPKE